MQARRAGWREAQVSDRALLRIAQALRDRLRQALTDAGESMPSVFVGPLDDPDVNNASLILFLYRVMPNASLRNREHRVGSTGALQPVIVHRNALPLDLYFLLTVGTLPGSEEQRLHTLGIAMQSLQAEPEFTGAPVGHETVRVSIEPTSTEELSRIWALFPTANYRTSVAYLATPVWIDPAAGASAAAPVVRDELHAGHRVDRA